LGAAVVVGGGGGGGVVWVSAGWLTGRGFAGLGGVVVVVVVVAAAAARVAVVALLVDELELAEPHPATPRATPKSRTSGRSLGVMVFS
jgi:hypothetical protein